MSRVFSRKRTISIVLSLILLVSMTVTSFAASQFYTFGATSYSNYIDIKQGTYFNNPITISIELSGMPKGLGYQLNYIDSSGNVVRSEYKVNSSTSWVSFYPTTYHYNERTGTQYSPLPSGSYKLRLVNVESQKVYLSQGEVEYTK